MDKKLDKNAKVCYYFLPMLPTKIAFIDLETTGTRALYDRVIEIGIVRVENNKVVKTFHSLLDPQGHLPPEITMITGITAGDLEGAPTFRNIKDEVLETLADCVFVAHNVRFDYSFLKSEFKRENISFSTKHFCTVRLSRLLYPSHRHHNLDALIERFGFTCSARHRALEDAQVLYQFYQHIQKEFPPEHIVDVIGRTMKRPSIPLKLQSSALENLPEGPGVYIFYGAKENENAPNTPAAAAFDADADTLSQIPLYIGKSINIRTRVLSHFSADIHSPIEMKISQQIESIETIATSGELGALFLESRLIKSMLPLYNKKSRIKHELIALHKITNKEGYDIIQMEPFKAADYQLQSFNDTTPQRGPTSATAQLCDFETFIDSFLGFFRSRRQAKSYLAVIAKEYSLCEKLLGLEKTSTACFAYRLNRCKGACTGREKPLIYNLRVLTAFSKTKILRWPFKGPILIEEKMSESEREYFLVDKWCYLGSVWVDENGNKKSTFAENLTFDLDIYQILRQYLKKSNNFANIQALTTTQLRNLTSQNQEFESGNHDVLFPDS